MPPYRRYPYRRSAYRRRPTTYRRAYKPRSYARRTYRRAPFKRSYRRCPTGSTRIGKFGCKPKTQELENIVAALKAMPSVKHVKKGSCSNCQHNDANMGQQPHMQHGTDNRKRAAHEATYAGKAESMFENTAGFASLEQGLMTFGSGL